MFFINKGYPTLIVRNRRYTELEKLKPNPGSRTQERNDTHDKQPNKSNN